MAKKIEIKALMNSEQKNSIIENLEKTLQVTNANGTATAEEIAEQTVNNEPMFTVENIEKAPEEETVNKPETNNPDEQVNQPLATEEKKSSTMFEDLFNQQTEEDLKKNVSRAEHIAETISDADLEDDDFDLNEESPAVKKQTADVEATMIVEGGEMVMSVLCMWIAKDWEAFSTNKYVIGKEKKKALKIAIMRMILLKNKKRSPVWSIIGLCIGSCVPMFAMALLTLKAKQKQQQDNAALIAQQRALILAENEKAAREYAERMAQNEAALRENLSNTGEVNPIVIKRETKQPLVVVKKESRGRHKKGCNYYKGKPCNCKK